MNETLPTVYISILLVLLGGVAFFIFRQILKTRRQETRLDKLQKQLQAKEGSAKEYYELGSLYLEKKLYVQSIKVFQKAFKVAEKEQIEGDNLALIYNAIGFAYFKQEQYDIAIRNYKDALKLAPGYIIALNNLGNVYEKKSLMSQALETYEETLKYEPDNAIAKRRAESIRKRLVTS